MIRMFGVLPAVLLMILTMSVPVIGQKLADDLQIHGFVSQGFWKTTKNNYLVDNSKEGSFEFNDMALTLLSSPSDRLIIGLQLNGRDLGTEFNNNITLDLAYGDYRWRDYLGFRIGKIKLPQALYNDIRDIDLERTAILLPQGIYYEHRRDFMFAANGLSLYGNVLTEETGDFDYQLVYGNYNVANTRSAIFREGFRMMGNGVLSNMINTQGFLDMSRFEGSSDEVVVVRNNIAARLIWNTPFDGLRVGGVYFSLEPKLDFTLNFNMLSDNSNDPMNPVSTPKAVPVSVKNRASAGVYFGEYTWDDLILVGELRIKTRRKTVTLNEVKQDPTKVVSEEFYGQASYRINDLVSLGTYYSNVYADRDDKEGANQAAMGNPDYFAWQKDMAFTTRLDITDNWLVKFEYHRINGTAHVLDFFNDQMRRENWSLFAMMSTFHF